MKYIFLLSGDYIDLGKEEVFSLFNIEKYGLVDRLLIVDLKNINEDLFTKLKQRLALTKRSYKFLFECKFSELIDEIKNYDWSSVYRDNFCLRLHHFNNNSNKKLNNKKILNKQHKTTSESKGDRSNPFVITSEKELAKYIWHSVSNPKVNLKNPKTKIELFFNKDKVYCGLLIYENKEDFESRKSHLRPFPHPSSLHPKLARALVNIVGIKENEILLDPFCGTGGFLIEAGLMNIKVVGYDISKNMVKGCKENLEYFKIKNYVIKNKNALDINGGFDCVVTDLPYGLNSNVYLKSSERTLKERSNRINLKNAKTSQIQNIEKFYMQFLKRIKKSIKAAVIIFPSFVDYKSIIKRAGFRIEKEMSVYVHRSLTRKITRIRPN